MRALKFFFAIDVVAVVFVGGYVEVFEQKIPLAVCECGTEAFFPIVLPVGSEKVFVFFSGLDIDPCEPHGYFGEDLALGAVVPAYGIVLTGVFYAYDFLFEEYAELVHLFTDDRE